MAIHGPPSPRSVLNFDDLVGAGVERLFPYFGDVDTDPEDMPESRAKHWCFTLNNYEAVDTARLSALINNCNECVYIIFGKEVGENGTPHLQGFVSFSTRFRFTQVSNLIGRAAHVEVARNVPQSIQYCKKDNDFYEFGEATSTQGSRGDLDAFKDAVKGGMLQLDEIRETHSEVYAKYTRFCIEYIQDHYPKRELPAHPLRNWQQNLNAILNRAADDRTIYFVVDITGNSGKTWFAHYYSSLHNDVQVLLPGKKADMTFALNPTIRVLFVDAPRSKQGEYLQYDFLEEVKNGYVFSSKYESRIKTLSKCHIVVLMNEMPDLTKLSADRYEIIQVA